MVVDCHAVGDVGVATVKNGPAAPARPPRVEAPTEATKNPDADSNAERQSNSQHDAHGRCYHHKARVGGKQPAPDGPRIVIGDVNHSRIHGHNCDQAGVNNYTLLRRRYQPVRLLRLQPHGLDSVHDVSRLVVVGIAQLRCPRGILRQVIQNGRKRREAFDSRVPSLSVRPGRALIGRQIHVLVQPGIRRGDLIRISGARQYLSHQRVRV